MESKSYQKGFLPYALAAFLVGAVGGAWNAVIMDRARRYAAIKYEKRFLIRRRLERD